MHLPKDPSAIIARHMALATGTRLGPYEIVSAIGAGGMGEVYRARDTRLDRTVAIKILPRHLAERTDAKERFDREARSISSLSHPHICHLYDVGAQDGTSYLVMEYLEGETLAERLRKGALPSDKFFKIANEICEGLEKAHRSGVIHRDVKPGNIMLTKSGAKLMDFGLAKPLSTITPPSELTATRSDPLTEKGILVGTVQYMSPEQLEGKELDGRSDIFSFGAVLYEMWTGTRAFEGKTHLSVASAIMEREPAPLTSHARSTPANLNHVIKRCLAKDPDERWQTARDLASELNWTSQTGTPDAPLAIQTSRKRTGTFQTLLPWLLCGLLVAALVAAMMIHRSADDIHQASYFLAVLPFPVHDMAISPNGRTVAIVGFSEAKKTNALWLYDVGGREQRSLPDTEGASFPFWSPDGNSLGFFAFGKLKKLEIRGGPVQVICDAPSGRGGTWNKDGVIVFTPSGQLMDGLYRVSATGGTPTRISLPEASRGENSHRWPVFLPDGKHFLYLAANVSGLVDPDAIYVGALDSKEKKFVTKATGNAEYAMPGFLLFCRDKTLYAQRFDAGKLELSGEAVPLRRDLAYLPRILHAVFSASDEGALLAQGGSGVSLSRLLWRDRKGAEIGELSKPDVYANLTIAPNGKSVALDKTDEDNQNADVWTYDLQPSSIKRLTFNPAIDSAPIWSPHGNQLLFASARGGTFQLCLKNADGTGEEKLLNLEAADKADAYPTDWSRDGKHILYQRGTELWVVEMPGLKTRPLVKGAFTSKNGQFSPDGKWVAYTSNESGKWEIYVTSFPEASGKWQVSTAGGTQPRWRGDGKELFYLAADGKIMATPLMAGSNFNAGTPVALFESNARELVATSELVSYDVTKDGQRFLINTQMERAEMQPMMVVLNWAEELKKK
ncbi:MAG: eukaryotic-like serine/threonine-protein kinase [Acidobacteriaceae bacterium]